MTVPQPAVPAPRNPAAPGPGRLVAVALFAVQGWTALHLCWLRAQAAFEGVEGPVRYKAPFLQLFALVDWAGALLNVVALGAAFAIAPGRRVWGWIDRIAAGLGRRAGWVAVVVAGLSAVACLTVHHGYPFIMDEHAPSFQAKILARGRLVGQWPPQLAPLLVAPEFARGFLVTSPVTGEVCSNYRPGHALLLTPFTWLGIPWALNPLLAGLSVWMIAAIAARIHGPAAAGWAVLFTLGAPVFWAYGMSFYAMSAHLCLNLAYTWLMLQPTLPRLAAAGLVGGYALELHNPFPHFLFAIPWIAAVSAGPRRLVRLTVLMACYALVCLPLETRWAAVVEAVRADRPVGRAAAPAGESRPARVRQAGVEPGAAARSAPPPLSAPAPPAPLSARLWGFWNEVLGALTPLPLGQLLLLRYTSAVKLVAWDAPGLVVLACVGGWLARDRRPVVLLAASGFVTFAGYALVAMSGGFGWGYRYFFPAWGCLPLLAAGLVTARSDGWKLLLRRAGLAAVIGCAVILPVRCWQIHDFITEQLSQRPPRPSGDPPAGGFFVSFIDPDTGWFRGDLIRNEPFLEPGPAVLVSQGLATDVLVVEDLARQAGMTYDNTYTGPEGSTWVVAPELRPSR